MNKENLIQKTTSSISFKFILVGILSLLLLIPAGSIKSLIMERQLRSDEVKEEVGNLWGDQQAISGPVLSLPLVFKEKADDEIIDVKRWYHILPEQLSIKTNLVPEERYRGIFKVIVYTSSLNFDGYFKIPDFSEFKIRPDEILFDQAVLDINLSDNRGLKDNPSLLADNHELEIIPGSEVFDHLEGGFHSYFELDSSEITKEIHFNLQLNLAGSEKLTLFPLGKQTSAEISGNWGDPSFTGSFLPEEREITESSFTANWVITQLNRSYPQNWYKGTHSVNDSDFGVELIKPADHYQKSLRSVKYALMFIALTFLVYILNEILNKRKFHPVQYVLVGLALVVFYVLLVSLSEHLGFNLAYVISAALTIILISYYTYSSFKEKKSTLIAASTLTVLYVFLFVNLQLKDYGLLFGSIGLFIALALFMILTRNIKWYNNV